VCGLWVVAVSGFGCVCDVSGEVFAGVGACPTGRRGVMHSAEDHDCNLNDRYGKPSCMDEFRIEVREEAIRDCIAAVEALDDGGVADFRYILASTAATLRALLEGEKP